MACFILRAGPAIKPCRLRAGVPALATPAAGPSNIIAAPAATAAQRIRLRIPIPLFPERMLLADTTDSGKRHRAQACRRRCGIGGPGRPTGSITKGAGPHVAPSSGKSGTVRSDVA